MISKKISVIVPVYNTEKFLKQCLKCLLEQTYKNIEVILVNDGSPGNCKEIYEEYKKIDERIKYVEHKENKGLFAARITGVKASTGDYIAFLDSDDHITVDFFRALIYKAEEVQSDITFTNLILEINYDNDRQIQYNLFDTKFKNLEGKEALDEYFNQEGLNFSWHTTPNKIYSRRIWELALKDYEKVDKHLIMTEDFAFSSVLFYYAKKVTKVDTEAMFYCKHDGASTSVNNITYNKIEKNLTDLTTSFNFVESFLKDKNIYDKYKEKFIRWKSIYCTQHKCIADNASLTSNERKKIEKIYENLQPIDEKIRDDGFFSSISTDWNNELDDLKRKIFDPKIKYVSFDIFDTLIVRPFFFPKDLFVLLNKSFVSISEGNINIDFSDMRENAEMIARKDINDEKQEITIDEIYLKMKEIYKIPEETLETMKNLEKQYELKYCTKRNTAYQLYQLAKYLDKKVICISDMYLSKEDLKDILNKNGYNEIDNIFVSCELNSTKDSGNLYKTVIQDLEIKPSEILHIGDNNKSDYENAKKCGINSVFFPKPTAIASDPNYTNNLYQIFLKDLPFWEDNVASMNFIGIRCMLAVIANKYFDNPYRTFNQSSNLNGDPELIGYFVLGMYMFGIGKWLTDNALKEKYDSIVFMARDGYLPMEVYKLFKKLYNTLPEEKYLFISRKALIPAVIQSKNDYYKISEIINIYNNTPLKVFEYIKDTVEYDKEKFESICKEQSIKLDENFKDMAAFSNFIQIIVNNFYNEEKHKENLSKLKNYYNSFYKGKSANFDVGYSCRPEFFISKLCNKRIDTYFANINCDEAIKYSKNGNLKLHTFFEYKPHITGNFYELCLSALAPSCIGYNFEKNEVEPIFEKHKNTYQEEFIIKKIQQASLDFIQDMINIFEDKIEDLYYQNYYITLPIQSYVHSSNEIDRRLFNAFKFEDDIRNGEKISVSTLWENEQLMHNQHVLDQLLSNYNITYNFRKVDLSNRNKLVRLIYYLFFDRVTLKRRVNEILYNHRNLKRIARKIYHLLKKIKK